MSVSWPPLYGITAVALFPSIAAFLSRLEHALATLDLRLLQVRDKQLDKDSRATLAAECVRRARPHGCRVLVNDDAALARTVGADGVHVSSGKLEQVNRDELPGIVGVSCHDAAQLDAGLVRLQADFAVLSPVLRTLSHVDATPLGWDGFGELARARDRPVYALGGLRTGDLAQAQACGAVGLASMRSVWDLEPRPAGRC